MPHSQSMDRKNLGQLSCLGALYHPLLRGLRGEFRHGFAWERGTGLELATACLGSRTASFAPVVSSPKIGPVSPFSPSRVTRFIVPSPPSLVLYGPKADPFRALGEKT